MRQVTLRCALLMGGLSCLSLLACSSEGGKPQAMPEPQASGASTSQTPIVGCEAPAPQVAPLRRLSNYEYRNTLEDLTGDAALADRISRDLVREPTSLGFRNSATALTISPLVADRYVLAALDAAHGLLDKPGWFPCNLAAVEPACIADFVSTFGELVYRRPLTQDELARFSGLYAQSIELEADPRKAVEWVTATMLSSSHFLFRVELDAAQDVHRPASYEMASRLSYLLWQTMPDAELFRAAKAGELADPAKIEAQVRRMLASPKAFRVYEFFEQWLNLDELASLARDAEVYPEFSPHLVELLAAEGRSFIYELLSNGGTLKDLFSADFTLANHELALHYGLTDVPDGTSFVKVQAPGRSGVLTQAGLIVHDHAASTSMVRRGLKLRTELLCQTVPAPPADVDVSPPVINGELTQRERLNQHRTKESCAVCHQLMDPVGAVFDTFDAVGRARTSDEAGAAIEIGGDIIGSRDLDGHYDSVPALGVALANSEEVQQCVVRQAFRFFYGRELTAADSCAAEQIMQGFAREGFRLSDLIFGLTRSDQFLFRSPSAQVEEVTP
jgi:Protein of unknown function (DUF1592)/Protein of unknown function (DUF1588)/Protein of unknown function (DUF1595)/Protein of unknown function (DUF1585)/Protein of unknown function (DUF1587)